jgi:outer membrane protein, heavy metal efflux system
VVTAGLAHEQTLSEPAPAKQTPRLTAAEGIDQGDRARPGATQTSRGPSDTFRLAAGEHLVSARSASQGTMPFADTTVLSADALVEQVLARNPSLTEMVAAYQVASARYPQVTSLDDPMFGVTVGPETIAPDDKGGEFAYRLEASQKYPWPGKLKLRGEYALAEARAASGDVDDMRLQLVESTKTAFYDYYLVARALAVNDETLQRLGEFH